MIKFEHDRPQISCQKVCWKKYDGANSLKWNFEVELFIVRWIVQMKEDTYKLKVIEYHMLYLSVVGMERCCRLVLRFQEGRDVN